MPGRRGSLSSSGLWTGTGGNSLQVHLAINNRSGNTPNEYKATIDIEFVDGFESGDGDNFEAFITTDNIGGGTSGSVADGGNSYRYGFNGKENDNDIEGEGNAQDYGMRIYDPRVGRFLSVDPLARSYPMLTPYSYAENDVIRCIDLDGLEKFVVTNKYINGHLREIRLQTTYDKERKEYVNMQFKYANGNRVTLQDVMVINKYYKDGKLANDNFAFGDNLTKDQNKLLNSTRKVDVTNAKTEDYHIENHPEIQEASFAANGLAEVDGVKRIPLIINLKQSLNAGSFYYLSPAGTGQMLSRSEASVVAGGNRDLLKLYDLPSTIKEDGGIKAIDITINNAFSNEVSDKDFSGLVQGLNKIGEQLKSMYQKATGVKAVNVHINGQRTSDYKHVNVSTPDVQINLKR